MQLPAWQVSVCVQASPSLQAPPSAAFGLEHVPLAGSQVPASWHWSRAAQTTGFVPVQMPDWQLSVWVQASPSAQAAPSVLFGLEQVPLAGSQTPASWHWSRAVQTTGFVPVQTPAWQESLCVQASPSVQALPSSQDPGLFMCPQPTAGSQESSVHGLSSSQPSAGPPTQVPFEHWSEVVHALPSSQPLLLKPVTWQMPAPSQVLLSVQTF